MSESETWAWTGPNDPNRPVAIKKKFYCQIKLSCVINFLADCIMMKCPNLRQWMNYWELELELFKVWPTLLLTASHWLCCTMEDHFLQPKKWNLGTWWASWWLHRPFKGIYSRKQVPPAPQPHPLAPCPKHFSVLFFPLVGQTHF